MTDWLYNGLVEWLAERVQGMLAGLVAFLTATFFTSPDVIVFPQVQLLAGRSAVVVDAGFVVAIIAAGAITVHGRSLDELHETAAGVRSAAASMLLDLQPATFRHHLGYTTTTLPLGVDALGMRRIFDTRSRSSTSLSTFTTPAAARP